MSCLSFYNAHLEDQTQINWNSCNLPPTPPPLSTPILKLAKPDLDFAARVEPVSLDHYFSATVAAATCWESAQLFWRLHPILHVTCSWAPRMNWREWASLLLYKAHLPLNIRPSSRLVVLVPLFLNLPRSPLLFQLQAASQARTQT